MNQLDLFDAPQEDQARLKPQLERIFDLMKDGEWRTLPRISRETVVSEAGVSARLRDFRKEKFKAKYPVKSVEKRVVKKGQPLREYIQGIQIAATATPASKALMPVRYPSPDLKICTPNALSRLSMSIGMTTRIRLPIRLPVSTILKTVPNANRCEMTLSVCMVS